LVGKKKKKKSLRPISTQKERNPLLEEKPVSIISEDVRRKAPLEKKGGHSSCEEATPSGS